MSFPLNVLPSPQMLTLSSFMATTSIVPVTARPTGVVLKYGTPAVEMWNAPHCSAARLSRRRERSEGSSPSESPVFIIRVPAATRRVRVHFEAVPDLTVPIGNIVAATPRSRLLTLNVQEHALRYLPGQAVMVGAHGQAE